MKGIDKVVDGSLATETLTGPLDSTLSGIQKVLAKKYLSEAQLKELLSGDVATAIEIARTTANIDASYGSILKYVYFTIHTHIEKRILDTNQEEDMFLPYGSIYGATTIKTLKTVIGLEIPDSAKAMYLYGIWRSYIKSSQSEYDMEKVDNPNIEKKNFGEWLMDRINIEYSISRGRYDLMYNMDEEESNQVNNIVKEMNSLFMRDEISLLYSVFVESGLDGVQRLIDKK